MKINKKEILQQQEYNRLYEVLDQDTQWGVEYIMSLKAQIETHVKVNHDLSKQIASQKRTIDDYKVEITYYRNTIKTK